MINEHARATEPGFTRLMIEKPFGRDSETFHELNDKTASCFHETQLYRLDHYLGKEVILNISTLRWANQLFEPTWNREYIESVQITFKEDFGLQGRGGYFDTFGIIRDIMQNHLLQVMMWIAMDAPEDMSAAKIIEAKVKLLKCIKTIKHSPSTCFLGQFGPSKYTVGTKEFNEPGYLDDETVPKGSRCPTFASLLLQVDNTRWRGVPFLMTAGKGLDERLCEVRVRYKQKPHNKLITVMSGRQLHANELVMRIQPNESLYMTTMSKVPDLNTFASAEEPGLKWVPKSTVMDMSYDKSFTDAYVGDAYERMFLNAALGDQSLFVSADELVEMWRIFTPLLHKIDDEKPEVVLYPFGMVPPGFPEWAAARGAAPKPTWQEFLALHSDHVGELRAMFNELDVDNKGRLEGPEIFELAKRFYDGREPTMKQIAAIMDRIDAGGTGSVTWDEFVKGAGVIASAFRTPIEPKIGWRE